MLFRLKCNYLPFNVAFSSNFSQKESYIRKYKNKYLNVINGDYPNLKNFINVKDSNDIIKFNLKELKEQKKLKTEHLTFETSSDYKVTLSVNYLLDLTKILDIKEETFIGYASSPLKPVYVFNNANEMGMILPIKFINNE